MEYITLSLKKGLKTRSNLLSFKKFSLILKEKKFKKSFLVYNLVTLLEGFSLSDLTLVMLGAGNSTRFNLGVKKQWLRVDEEPLWLVATKRLEKMYEFQKIIVVGQQDELSYMENFANYLFCSGGESRQESLKNALEHVDSEFVMVSDIARVCASKEIISRLIASKGCADIIVPTLRISDTAFYDDNPIIREDLRLIQTPQLSKTSILKDALKSNTIFTDDSSAIKAKGGTVWFVEGDSSAHKLTYKKDKSELGCLKPPSNRALVGLGFDIHAFSNKGPLLLGGVKLSDEFGFLAHSDGDVLLHALCDALLGAAGAGDIGEHFPDSDEKYKGISSQTLLLRVADFIKKVGFEIGNCDITIIAQKPKINPFKKEIKLNIAKLLNLPPSKINIKASTTEKLGAIGKEEGVCVLVNTVLYYFDWTKDEDTNC